MNCGCLLLLPSDWLYHVMNCPVHCSSFTHDFCNINFLVFQYHQKKKSVFPNYIAWQSYLQEKKTKQDETYPHSTIVISFAHVGKGGSTRLLWRLSGLSYLLLVTTSTLRHTHKITMQRYIYQNHSRFLP